MIMPRGQQLLLPVNPAFIAVSLLIGLPSIWCHWGAGCGCQIC